jgi:hypothetical protein
MITQELKQRAHIVMWGCLACAQPWLVAGSLWGTFWTALAVVASLITLRK